MIDNKQGNWKFNNLEPYLNVGIALVNKDSMIIEYENGNFQSWLKPTKQFDSIGNLLPNLNQNLLNKRLQRGREYNIDTEIEDNGKRKNLKISFSLIVDDGKDIILLVVSDNTKFKELEYMTDSYAKLAEKNKSDLEKALGVIKKQNERMKNELAIARQVQMGMLPFNFDPNNSKIQFSALLKPAKEVGGDYFDIFYVDSNHLCFCLGDVSDKGAGSALFMAAAKTMIRLHTSITRKVSEIVSIVNNKLTINNGNCMFSTLFFGIMNIKTGILKFSNCGHCYPIIYDKNGEVNILKSMNGPAVGIIENAKFTEQSAQILENETMLLYSDGVTESFDKDGNMYSDLRLINEMKTLNISLKPEEIINSIFDSVVEFEKGTEQSDDISMMAIKYLA